MRISTQIVSRCLTLLFPISIGTPLIAPPTFAQSAPPFQQNQCASQLDPAIDKIIGQPSVNSAQWGILIQALNNPSSDLYNRNADQLLMPASNAKLLTTAAALTRLTPRFRKQTPFLASGQAPNLNTLRIVGQGDPTLNDAKLEQIATLFQSKGIRSIGTLIGDDSVFQGPLISPTWTWDDVQGGDGLPVNSLMLNGNVMVLQLFPQKVGEPLGLKWRAQTPSATLTIQNRSTTVKGSKGSAQKFPEVNREDNQLVVSGQLSPGAGPENVDVPVPNPGFAFVERFQGMLAARNIQVGQLSVVNTPIAPAQEWPITAIDFPSLSALITESNQNSNNLHTEVLLKLMGSQTPTLAKSYADSGLAVLQQTLTQMGVDPKGYRLLDGSGLSRQNLSSPKAMVQTLRAIAQSPYRTLFRASLAVAGRSGTLSERFVNTQVQGRLFAKTGTLKGAATLSGYLESPSRSTLVLSILANDPTRSSSILRQTIDKIVVAIAQAESCTKASKRDILQRASINSSSSFNVHKDNRSVDPSMFYAVNPIRGLIPNDFSASPKK
jgi:serine-type D-Ala-D-Ala carboxypeptidase/endopeptidase (penicillin-binding protein 4)